MFDLVLAGVAFVVLMVYATLGVTAYHLFPLRTWQPPPKFEGLNCRDCRGGAQAGKQCYHWEHNRQNCCLPKTIPWNRGGSASWFAAFLWPVALATFVSCMVSKGPHRWGRFVARRIQPERITPECLAILEAEVGVNQ